MTELSTPEGFKRMYREQLQYVLSTLDRLGAPPLMREELFHDVMMTVFRKRADYDPQRPFRPWVFGIAFRHMLNVRRKWAPELEDDELAGAVDKAAGPEESALATEARSLLFRAIQTLEPERRAVFLLHDLDGTPAPEIARALDIPLNTAYSRLRLARQDLMQATAQLREAAS